MTTSSKWTQDQKFRAGCWRLCMIGAEAPRRLLHFSVESWPKWCRENMKTVTRKKLSKEVSYYDVAVKLAGDDKDIPDIDHMDITYLADILAHPSSKLINDDLKKHVTCVRNLRNQLCHVDTLTMDEEKHRQVCDELLQAYDQIVHPTFQAKGYDAKRNFMKDLELTADPKACENISELDMEKMLGEIEGLKKQLEKEKEDGVNITREFHDLKAKDNLLAGMLVKADKITGEMMTAPTPPVNISEKHHGSIMENNTCAGRAFIQIGASASSTTRERQPSTSRREADTAMRPGSFPTSGVIPGFSGVIAIGPGPGGQSGVSINPNIGAETSVVVPGVTPASLVGAGSVLSPRSEIGGLGVSMVESVLQGSPTGKHYETINDQIIKENGGGPASQQGAGGAGGGEKMDNGGVIVGSAGSGGKSGGSGTPGLGGGDTPVLTNGVIEEEKEKTPGPSAAGSSTTSGGKKRKTKMKKMKKI